MNKVDYNKNIFINCPFDDEYRMKLRAIIFVIIFADYNPIISSSYTDSGRIRIDKIKELIENSRYGIHDLSRGKAKEVNEFFRFNMPFELGLDFGCRFFTRKRKNKKFLVLEKERYDYQKALSDIAGCDIKHHNDDVELIIEIVRDWFVDCIEVELLSGNMMWQIFNEFMTDFELKRKKEGYSRRNIKNMSPKEFEKFVRKWKSDK